MIDFRNMEGLALLPEEDMREAGLAMVEAIRDGLATRIRVDKDTGLYIDINTKLTHASLDIKEKKLWIRAEVGSFEFPYEGFELNSMSGATHTKFYFRAEDGTQLGLTISKL